MRNHMQMPSYLRWKLTAATYFFTVVTSRRRPLFRVPMHRRLLGSSFRDAKQRMPCEIDAVVLLPDHLHVLMRPSPDVDYSALWRLIKTLFTRRILALQDIRPNPVHRDAPYLREIGHGRRVGEAGVWQRRFYEHTIRDDDDWGRHVDYIHWNPVKHGLVKRPQDWRWSSVHRYVAAGLLVPNWPGNHELDLPDAGE